MKISSNYIPRIVLNDKVERKINNIDNFFLTERIAGPIPLLEKNEKGEFPKRAEGRILYF